MLSTATGVQFRQSKKNDRTRLPPDFLQRILEMSDLSYYPMGENGDEPVKATTIRVPLSLYRDLEFISELWDAFDEAREIEKRVKWKPTSVMERLLSIGVLGFSAQIGGLPKSDAERAELLRKAKPRVEALASKLKK